jgi:hypothetical protein
MRRVAGVAFMLLSLSAAPGAAAQEIGLPDGRVRVRIDGGRVSGNVGAFGFDSSSGHRDETFGPPVANATIGTGGITEGVDENGTLSGLGWPGPGTWDHVRYLNVERGQPRKGHPENAGSFGGVGRHWFTEWTVVSQAYASDTNETLVTVLEREGDRVTITDVVDPDEDLIARNFRFDTPVGNFAYYANLDPVTSRVPRVPSATDALADYGTDFATVYDELSSSMVHFRPFSVDPAPSVGVGDGVYIAVAGQDRAWQWQAGLEASGLVREGPLVDPYYDLQDGTLSGSTAAFGRTAGALRWRGGTSFTVFLTAASTQAEALAGVARARARGFDAIRAASETWWASWISRARLPATEDTQTLAVARHALMLIRTAQDRRTGAIVANATAQTPYRQDWVRDGSFFNYALLLAGYPEMALRHADFYLRVRRPGGTWDSFYYPDGGEAGFIYPYEIDSQGFALWALWLPYSMGAAGVDYLERAWPAIRETADALPLCGAKQCPAAEDDAIVPTQGAQGAAAVYLALRSAAAAAQVLGEDGSRWAARADALQAATDPHAVGRGGVYLVWPSRMFDGRANLQAIADGMDRLPPVGGFVQYPMEPLLALAPFWQGGEFGEPPAVALDRWVTWLTHEVAAPGVLDYGERIYRDGERSWLHSVGFPHIWSGAEMYIGASFVYGVTGCPVGEQVGEAECRG